MNLNDEIESYCLLNSSEEDPLLQHIVRQTYLRMIHPRMLSGHLQGRLLSFISNMVHPKRILEIGTYTGYATICLAEGLTEEGLIHTIEINPENEAFILENFHASTKPNAFKLHIGNALEIIPQLNEIFDLVFIDGDKSQYLEYFNLIISQVKIGGIIIADNVLWGGKVLQEASRRDSETIAIKAFNEMIRQHPKLEKLMLPLRDGLTIMIKNA